MTASAVRRWRASGPVAALAVAGLVAGCGEPAREGWSGYVEGDFVQVALPQAGRLATLPAAEGSRVAAGATLFTLEGTPEQRAADEADARWRAAQAQARDADSGRRADEIAVTQAQRAQAAAQAALAASELARVEGLRAQGFVSPAAVDDARTAKAQADARVAELDAALRSARLPARPEARRAADAQAQAASAALAAAQWRLSQTRAEAPAAGEVAQTYYRVGEWVGAGQPVLSLLPAGAVKARFFVREDEVASISPGQSVALHCDGCGGPIAATVTAIATEAEYTPPVIYSNAQRARLVFRVDARPAAADAARLRPGQPLDVTRAPG